MRPLILIFQNERNRVLKGEPAMKSKEELSALKKEIETLNQKLAELTEEELTQVTGGSYADQYGSGTTAYWDSASSNEYKWGSPDGTRSW